MTTQCVITTAGSRASLFIGKATRCIRHAWLGALLPVLFANQHLCRAPGRKPGARPEAAQSPQPSMEPIASRTGMNRLSGQSHSRRSRKPGSAIEGTTPSSGRRAAWIPLCATVDLLPGDLTRKGSRDKAGGGLIPGARTAQRWRMARNARGAPPPRSARRAATAAEVQRVGRDSSPTEAALERPYAGPK
jgi:hypothetical protein